MAGVDITPEEALQRARGGPAGSTSDPANTGSDQPATAAWRAVAECTLQDALAALEDSGGVLLDVQSAQEVEAGCALLTAVPSRMCLMLAPQQTVWCGWQGRNRGVKRTGIMQRGADQSDTQASPLVTGIV